MEGRAYFSSGDKSFKLINISEERVRWFYLLYEGNRRLISKIKIGKNNLWWACNVLKEASPEEGNLCRRCGRKIEAYLYRVYQNFNSYGWLVCSFELRHWWVIWNYRWSFEKLLTIEDGMKVQTILGFLWRPPQPTTGLEL